MSDDALARPTIGHLLDPALAALASGEMVLPEMSDSVEAQGAQIEDGPVDGLGVVSDAETGLRVLALPYRMVRGTAEYQGYLSAHKAALQAAADDGRPLSEAAELALEDGVHEFLHNAFAVNEAGGDDALDEFLLQGLLPQAAFIWALLDAYSQLVRHRLPEFNDYPFEVAEDMFGTVDPYAEDGRALIKELWAHVEGEMHPASVHAPYEVLAARKLKPVSKKAKKHALRHAGRTGN